MDLLFAAVFLVFVAATVGAAVFFDRLAQPRKPKP
jgi:hypothetical protein